MVRTTKAILILAICIITPLLVGGLSSLLTRNQMSAFGEMNQPPGSPPAWVFPVAWTVLYILMGAASFLIFCSNSESRGLILILYAAQLMLNFIWSPVFFNLQMYWLAFIILFVMWIMIVAIMIMARDVSVIASYMLLPYAVWCIYAMYLNIGIIVLAK